MGKICQVRTTLSPPAFSQKLLFLMCASKEVYDARVVNVVCACVYEYVLGMCECTCVCVCACARSGPPPWAASRFSKLAKNICLYLSI